MRHSGFVARELLPEHLVVADLVLTGSAEQRHQVTLLDAIRGGRAFTLREFARLAEGLDVACLPDSAPARARELVARMAARRTQLPAAPVEDDIADPYGAPLHVFRLCAEQISECLGGLRRPGGRPPARAIDAGANHGAPVNGITGVREYLLVLLVAAAATYLTTGLIRAGGHRRRRDDRGPGP